MLCGLTPRPLDGSITKMPKSSGFQQQTPLRHSALYEHSRDDRQPKKRRVTVVDTRILLLRVAREICSSR